MKIPFHLRLFWTISLLFAVFIIFVYFFQLGREKQFSEMKVEASLSTINHVVYHQYQKSGSLLTAAEVNNIVENNDLRITIISLDGKVLLDNKVPDISTMDNHLRRKEVSEAIENPERGGTAIRQSSSKHIPYYYYAQKIDSVIVRSALPYNEATISMLSANRTLSNSLVLIGIVALLTIGYFTLKLGRGISQLQEVTESAERGDLVAYNSSEMSGSDLGRIASDITKIYKSLSDTKNALAVEKEKLINHISLSKEGLAIFDGEKREIWVNSLFFQNLNMLSDHKINRSEEIFMIEEFREMNRFINSTLINSPYQLKISPIMSIHKDGKIFTLQSVIFEDCTFEVAIAERTQQEQESLLKKQLTQNIAHELKTPVSSIQGYLETILENKNLTQEQKAFFLSRCYHQTERLGQLLKDISILHRLDDFGEMINKEQVDLNQIIRDVQNDTELQLKEKKMALEVSIPDSAQIYGNYSLLYSVFRNLMDNAIAYAGDSATITINCYREDKEFYYFRFADNGIGVSEEHLKRIFERFYRVDKGRSRKLGGTGLGLAIVKNAIIAHHGEISARKALEGGLEFLFMLQKDSQKEQV